jgi:hypothetical protein
MRGYYQRTGELPQRFQYLATTRSKLENTVAELMELYEAAQERTEKVFFV